MYLRLFREIADLEARADAEEAKGVTPSKLRNYHQWRIGLSPVRGAQLRDAALECLKGLKSEGLVDERGGSPGGARVPGRAERIMERVGVGADSLAAAMGPAEFAYLDSLVRRYMATPTLGSRDQGPSAGPGGALAIGSPLSTARLTARCSTAPPTGCEDVPAGEFAASYGPLIPPYIAYFLPQLYASGGVYDGYEVKEFLGPESDGCKMAYPDAGVDEATGTAGWGSMWTIVNGQYDSPDLVGVGGNWASGYSWYLSVSDPGNSCYETQSQEMNIWCPKYTSYEWYSTTNPSPRMVASVGMVVAIRGNGSVSMPLD
jgi:hypothetical protein